MGKEKDESNLPTKSLHSLHFPQLNLSSEPITRRGQVPTRRDLATNSTTHTEEFLAFPKEPWGHCSVTCHVEAETTQTFIWD